MFLWKSFVLVVKKTTAIVESSLREAPTRNRKPDGRTFFNVTNTKNTSRFE